jgi:hypothetical protein
MSALPADCPAGLAAAVAARRATLGVIFGDGARSYAHATSPDGALFLRWSEDESDVAVLAHEGEVRDAVGADGALRSPPVLERGEGWLLERGIEGGPVAGADAVASVVAAAAVLADARLPALAAPPGGLRHRLAVQGQRARSLLATPVGRDVIAARRLRRRSSLPLVTSHGDFHAGNLLMEGGRPWVVDWELLGRRQAGFDLLQLWPELAAPEDREPLFEATVELVGEPHRRALCELRYVLLVQAIVARLAPLGHVRDRAGGRALLALLPEVREAAR